MGQQDVETMYVPHDLGSMAIDLSGLGDGEGHSSQAHDGTS